MSLVYRSSFLFLYYSPEEAVRLPDAKAELSLQVPLPHIYKALWESDAGISITVVVKFDMCPVQLQSCQILEHATSLST